VPTVREAGYPTLEYVDWFGVFVPVKTPVDIVNKLNREIREALRTKGVHSGYAHLSLDIAGSSPSDFAQLLKFDTERWAQIVQASGFRPED
jgi:tripartite-type tricarboxylate transporter receptor subunit TctC